MIFTVELRIKLSVYKIAHRILNVTALPRKIQKAI